MITTSDIFSISGQKQFEKIALKVFRFQYENNLVYKKFCDLLKTDVQKVKSLQQIPFLPIQFFKSHEVVSNTNPVQEIFISSGTTGMITSKHLVTDVALYEESFRKGFSEFYGTIEDYVVLALLPSYLEREGSSLIYMVDDLLKQSKHPKSGYFLHDLASLYQTLLSLKETKQKTILIGVTYALLDFAEQFKIDFPELIVMETGGMKGKRKEMIRQELHEILCTSFGVKNIHSEYGMTELLSQAYSYGKGIFNCPPWMKILLRDTSDPLSLLEGKQSGGINVIDLANINSCSFIATQDLGKLNHNGSFEILGRFDNADIRGCNLLVQ